MCERSLRAFGGFERPIIDDEGEHAVSAKTKKTRE